MSDRNYPEGHRTSNICPFFALVGYSVPAALLTQLAPFVLLFLIFSNGQSMDSYLFLIEFYQLSLLDSFQLYSNDPFRFSAFRYDGNVPRG